MRAEDEIRRVLAAWFPAGLEHASPTTHAETFEGWFGDPPAPVPGWLAGHAAAAEAGFLRGWAKTPHGRLALILLLLQAPRGLYEGRPAAFAGDAAALRLAEDGLRDGHYDALEHPWERSFFLLPLAEAEGADHRQRLIRMGAMAEAVAWSTPDYLRPLYRLVVEQARAQRAVVERFGRFPERNAALGRAATAAEAAWLAGGAPSPLWTMPAAAWGPVAYPTTA